MYLSREGKVCKKVLNCGKIPFSANQAWVIKTQKGQDDLLVFDLAEFEATVVFEVSANYNKFTQVTDSTKKEFI